MDSSYTLTNNEVGKRITVTVSFTDGIGTEETVTSQPTAAVRDAASAASPGGGGGLPPPSNPMPSAPRNLVAIGGDEQVTLTWDAPDDDDDDAITRLRVPDRREGKLDIHRFHRHDPYGHRPHQRHGLRLPGADGQRSRQ